MKRWEVHFADQYLIRIESSENKRQPWSGKPAKEAERMFAQAYPAVHAYLHQFRTALTARDDQGKYFWELRSCTYWGEFEEPKIIYPDIAQAPEFALDVDAYLLGNTLYFLPTRNKSLLGLLNSKAVFWFYRKTSSQIRGGFARFFSQFVSQIPIPPISPTGPVGALTGKVLLVKQADASADVASLEREIDHLVYRAYGLTAEDIAIIEDAG